MKINDLENLIVLFNNGDENAFRTIYNKLSPGLHQYVRQFVKTREEAEDVVAETFLKVWTKRGHFQSIKKLESFLYVASKNAGIDRKRRVKMIYGKREEMLLTMEMENLVIPDPVTESLLTQIYLEIEKLPLRSREVIRLAYIEELKNVEIAMRMGTDEKTVRNQKLNAIKRLRLNILNRLRF